MSMEDYPQTLAHWYCEASKNSIAASSLSSTSRWTAAWRAERRPCASCTRASASGRGLLPDRARNLHGALKMFELGLRRLRRFAPECWALMYPALSPTRSGARRAQRLGPERLNELDRRLVSQDQFGSRRPQVKSEDG